MGFALQIEVMEPVEGVVGRAHLGAEDNGGEPLIGRAGVHGVGLAGEVVGHLGGAAPGFQQRQEFMPADEIAGLQLHHHQADLVRAAAILGPASLQHHGRHRQEQDDHPRDDRMSARRQRLRGRSFATLHGWFCVVAQLAAVSTLSSAESA